MVKKLTLFILVFLTARVNCQIGGSTSYRFLNLPMTTRAAALGGSNMSIWGDDINLIHSNPSLLNPGMSRQFAFNYSGHAGMNFFYFAQAYNIKSAGTAAISFQSFNYGQFTGYDELGNNTGDFTAGDYAINLNYAKPIADSMFNIGLALKTIISQYDGYHSYGNVLDFGITYRSKNDFVMSLLVKNAGFIWKHYSGNEKEALPNTVQLGLSKKVEKAPFRIFLVYDQLLKWNLGYRSPIDTGSRAGSFTTQELQKDSTRWQKFSERAGSRFDNFAKHVTFGTELLITKNFNLRVAYNYRRQSEMALTERRGINGLSLGFGIGVKRLAFSYAFTKLAFPANSHIIGLTLKW
jgi:hypothetical protein